MASERAKLAGVFFAGWFVFCLLGPITAVMYPPFFMYCYFRAKKESE